MLVRRTDEVEMCECRKSCLPSLQTRRLQSAFPPLRESAWATGRLVGVEHHFSAELLFCRQVLPPDLMCFIVQSVVIERGVNCSQQTALDPAGPRSHERGPEQGCKHAELASWLLSLQ